MARIFSGIQPSGALTIGHYVGTIKNWLELQAKHQCFFSVVDLHAITVTQDSQALRQNSLEVLALYIACGIDYKQQSLFIQSQVSAHAELAWILQCYSPLGQLQRMTQFKDKSDKHAANVGLLTYPVLMASDIALYNTELVPVGEDQKQHLEFARDIIIKFNNMYGEVLIVPEPIIAEQGARIMSLQEPNNKMSKSDPNNQAWLAILDRPEVITKKIKRAVTDSLADVSYDESRKGIANLMTIYSCIGGKSYAEIEQQYQGLGYGQFKADLADMLVACFEPIQTRYYELIKDNTLLLDIMEQGAQAANQEASKVLAKVKQAIGLLS